MEEAIINLRFEVWLRQNKMKPDTISKVKMKQSFHAGWVAKDWKVAK